MLSNNINWIFVFSFVIIIANVKLNSEIKPEYILTYFPYRQSGEFIRVILEFKNVSYKMELATTSTWPELKS